MKIAHAVAVARNGTIGADGGLPWRLPEDLKHFKRVTMGNPIVMGRKTYESIGRPLPGRANIVITRNANFTAEGIHVTPDIESAIAAAKTSGAGTGSDWVMIIGGGEIYRQTMDTVDRLYLTEIAADIAGDTAYPAFDRSLFTEIERQDIPADGDTPAYSFVTLNRG